MSQAITMPALSDTMSNGRLVRWTKKPGDRIMKGDVIAEVETDKAVMEVEAFQDGYLSGPLAAEGIEAPVGEVIGYIAEDRDAVSSAAAAPAAAVQSSGGNGNAAATQTSQAAPVSAVLAASMTLSRPAARPSAHAAAPRTAPEPAAPAHALKFTAAALQAGPPYRIERNPGYREAVARAMMASAATPSFRVTAQLPLQPLMSVAEARRCSVSLLLARACALTIAAHPLFNAVYTSEGLARRDRIDVAIAVDDGEALITPVLRDAARRPLDALAAEWITLREKAKSRRLAPADYSGATFYLSDLGVFSIVSSFDSIVPAGAAAILSVAASRPEGANFTLTCDHRVVFGADAARFLTTLDELLRDSKKLLAEEAR